VFAEPWQAQAFALAVRLSEQGYFTWKEWAAALAGELKAAADRGEPDDGSRYYEYWLAALERLVTAKGLSNPAAMLERKEAWADAYRHTPHGKPVELRELSIYSGSYRQNGSSASGLPVAPYARARDPPHSARYSHTPHRPSNCVGSCSDWNSGALR